VIFGIGDGGGLGIYDGEGFVGVGLFFDAVSCGGDENEDDDGHHDKDETTGERGARGVLGSGIGIWHGGGLAFWDREIN